MQDKAKRGDQTPSRKTKKIQIEIYEDHEASFYLALEFLKTSSKIDSNQVRLLIDSIHYTKPNTHELGNAKRELKMVWNYIYSAGKHSEDYRKVSTENFDLFLQSEFGQVITHLLQDFRMLKQVALQGENIQIKTQIATTSRLFQSLTEVEMDLSSDKKIPIINDKPYGIIKTLEDFFDIPVNTRKDLYLRQKAIGTIFDFVDHSFPELTLYTKSIVTGYLCIPLGIVDTEEVHNQSERTQTYHEYLGKTVRNTLKSKPFTSQQ